MNKDGDIFLTKDDVSRLFKCKSDKALRIMRFIYENGAGYKLGNQYYIKEGDFYDFMNQYKGRVIMI